MGMCVGSPQKALMAPLEAGDVRLAVRPGRRRASGLFGIGPVTG